MKRILFLIVLCFVCSEARVMNWKGVKDTSIITGFYKDTLRFSKAFNISDGENMSYYILANDTSAAGRASDSIKFYHGYQIGSMRRITGAWDTVWSNAIVQDTFKMDSLYNPTLLTGAQFWTTAIGTGVITAVGGQCDTTSATGYTYQQSWISPPWGHFIRIFVKGLTGNKTASKVVTIIGIDQRDHQEAR